MLAALFFIIVVFGFLTLVHTRVIDIPDFSGKLVVGVLFGMFLIALVAPESFFRELFPTSPKIGVWLAGGLRLFLFGFLVYFETKEARLSPCGELNDNKYSRFFLFLAFNALLILLWTGIQSI